MDAKDEIKQRLSIEEVISDYLELKRAGRNFKALSPFSSEKTPSFMVSPEKQIWHDFSSNKGGDMFSFIMEVEGVEFRESLEILARKANVDLSQYQKKGDGSLAALKKRLLAAHIAAAQFYHLCLSRTPKALDYIKNARGFTVETIRTWQLGYSPEDGTALYAFLKKRGFSDAELLKAGLTTRRRGGIGDMFRGRIMIPLADGQGNIVGFTSRVLEDGPAAGPKYLNTPQTPIYDKGRQVFGLHHAKPAIRTEDRVVLVEGNLDVIASHQAGVKNVVAAAGTAMTTDHLRSLSRLTMNITLAFDGDAAGLKATERAIGIAQEVGVDLRVVVLPGDAKDPDELIQHDSALWRQCIEAATDAVSWTLKRYESAHDATTAEGKRHLSTKALAVIHGLHDPVEQEHHLKRLARQLDVSVQSLMVKLRQTQPKVRAKKTTHTQLVAPDQTSYQDDFLALNAQFPEVRDSLRQFSVSALVGEQRQAIYQVLQQLPEHERLTSEQLAILKTDEDYGKILLLTAEEKYASWTPADLMAEVMALARRISKHSKEKDKNELTAAIRDAEDKGDSVLAGELLKQYQELLKGD
ncbi:MAG: DNA primase [Candidatus Saccharimonadales bacterium]